MRDEKELTKKELAEKELESGMAGPLAAALVALATFSLTVMGLVGVPRQSVVDEIFMILGLSSLLSAARIIDTVFDKVALNVSDRFRLIGGGYFLFCLIIGGISFSIMLLYATKSVTPELPWTVLGLALLTGFCITAMLMSHHGSEAWFAAIVVMVVVFVVELSHV
jgi:hypothetical protein